MVGRVERERELATRPGGRTAHFYGGSGWFFFFWHPPTSTDPPMPFTNDTQRRLGRPTTRSDGATLSLSLSLARRRFSGRKGLVMG